MSLGELTGASTTSAIDVMKANIKTTLTDDAEYSTAQSDEVAEQSGSAVLTLMTSAAGSSKPDSGQPGKNTHAQAPSLGGGDSTNISVILYMAVEALKALNQGTCFGLAIATRSNGVLAIFKAALLSASEFSDELESAESQREFGKNLGLYFLATIDDVGFIQANLRTMVQTLAANAPYFLATHLTLDSLNLEEVVLGFIDGSTDGMLDTSFATMRRATYHSYLTGLTTGVEDSTLTPELLTPALKLSFEKITSRLETTTNINNEATLFQTLKYFIQTWATNAATQLPLADDQAEVRADLEEWMTNATWDPKLTLDTSTYNWQKLQTDIPAISAASGFSLP